MTNSVTPITPRRAAGVELLSRRNAELLRQVQTAALARLNAIVTGVFEQVDDALFDLSEKAGSSGQQQQYFDGMREIRRKRQRVEEWFRLQVEKAYTDYAAGRVPVAADVAPAADDGELTLALVEDAVLEESLALSAMAARAENHLSQILHQVNRRLSALFGREEPDVITPLSPRVVCQAFVTAVRELDVTLAVRLIVLKLFERQLVSAHQQACEEANRILIEAGILPQLRFKAPQRRPDAPKMPGMPPAGAPGAQGAPIQTSDIMPPGPGEEPLTVELSPQLLTQLHQMLAARRGESAEYSTGSHAGGTGGHATGGAPGQAHVGPVHSGYTLSPNDLLNALTVLQAETRKIGAMPPVSPEELKQAVRAQAGRFTGQDKPRIQTNDEDAIDLVGMLFEFLVDDRELPDVVQALLARLQIPYVRTALLDRQLFAQKNHPARVLLDDMAEAGIGWSEQTDREGRVIGKMREVVDTVLDEFDDDVSLFGKLSEDFTTFIQNQRRRAELAEQRAAEAARGRERLEAARIAATRVIGRAMLQPNLPEVVREILSGPWTKYLEIVHARRGADSPEWRSATKLVVDLLWSVDPETARVEAKHWAAMLPSIDATLKQGLGAVGIHEADAHRMLAKLRTTFAGVLEAARIGASSAVGSGIVTTPQETSGSHDPVPVTSAQIEADIEAAAHAAGSTEANAEVEKETVAAQPTMAEHLATARALTVGQWLEFRDALGGTVRAKLSWVSAITQRYLFVNQNGLKVAEKTLHELAADFKLGLVRVLDDEALFARALTAIVKRLRAA